MPQNPVTATHFVHADRPRQTEPTTDPEHLTGASPPGEHADDPRQGPRVEHRGSTTTNTASVPQRSRLRIASERATERVIDAAASVTSLCLYVGGFRLAYELAAGVIGR